MMKGKEKRKKLTQEQKLQVVLDYSGLVKKIAGNYARKSMDPVEDLIQVGLIALLEAAANYKKGFNTKFKTYAVHYISGHIRHYLRDKQHLVKGPRSLQELSFKKRQLSRKLRQELGREPNTGELSKALAISSRRLDDIKNFERRVSVVWLDQVIKNDNEEDGRTTLLDKVVDPKTLAYLTDERENKIILKEAIQKLQPKIRALVELRYFSDMTQVEISNIYGISQMEVCRKLKKAEKELKQLINV